MPNFKVVFLLTRIEYWGPKLSIESHWKNNFFVKKTWFWCDIRVLPMWFRKGRAKEKVASCCNQKLWWLKIFWWCHWKMRFFDFHDFSIFMIFADLPPHISEPKRAWTLLLQCLVAPLFVYQTQKNSLLHQGTLEIWEGKVSYKRGKNVFLYFCVISLSYMSERKRAGRLRLQWSVSNVLVYIRSNF